MDKRIGNTDNTAVGFMLDFARRAITEFVTSGKIIELPKDYPKELEEKRGVFVTLNENGELRGCIGILSLRAIIRNLRDAAIEACADVRFMPVSKKELQDIDFEISVLTSPKLIDAKNPKELLQKINPGKDGLILESNGSSGLFLPQVWKDIPEKEEFMCHLCLKAGLSENAWLNGARVYKFGAEIYCGRLKPE